MHRSVGMLLVTYAQACHFAKSMADAVLFHRPTLARLACARSLAAFACSEGSQPVSMHDARISLYMWHVCEYNVALADGYHPFGPSPGRTVCFGSPAAHIA